MKYILYQQSQTKTIKINKKGKVIIVTYFNIRYESMEVYCKGNIVYSQTPDNKKGRYLATIRVADIVSMTTDDTIVTTRGDVTIVYKATYGAVDCIVDYLASRSDNADDIDAAVAAYHDKYFEVEQGEDEQMSVLNAPVSIDWWNLSE